jgi:hypothetical protein
MAIVALIRKNEAEVPSVIARIQKGDEFCFVVNQRKLSWHIARFDGRMNALDYKGEIETAGGSIASIVRILRDEIFKKHHEECESVS